MQMPSDEIIGQAAAEEQQDPTSNQEETSTAVPEGAVEAAEPEAGTIPEKFRGKSAIEIAEAYRNLERQYGKIASEKSHSEKEAERLRQELVAREQMLQAQAYQRQQPPMQSEPDPFANIEEELETDPKGAIKRIADAVKETPRKLQSELERRTRESRAAEYYQRQMSDNPEFRQLEPEMRRLAVQYHKLVHPDHLNSPETMELLYELAKSKNIGSYQKQAAEKAIQANNLVREEKRRAATESASGGSAGGSVRFEDMSLEEMRQALEAVTK